MKLLEISTGPQIDQTIKISETIQVIPLGRVGAAGRVGVLAELLEPHNLAALESHWANLKAQAELAEPAILIEIEPKADDVATLTAETWADYVRPIFENVRKSLTLIFGEGFAPFAEIALFEDGVGFNVIFPRARGIRFETTEPRDFAAEAIKIHSGLDHDSAFGFLMSHYDLYQVPLIRTRAPIGANRWT